MCLDFILLLKLTSYLRPLQSSSSPPLLSCSEARTTLFYFSFTSLPSLLFVISFYTGVDSHSIYRGWIHTMEGSRRTRSKNFFLLRIYSCTDTGWGRGGGIYIASSIEYVEEEDFSHISFSFPYTPFLPIISFLGIRLDGMMIGCCTYLSSLLKRLGVKSSPYFSYHPFLVSVQKKGYKYDGDHRITLFHPLVFFP